MRLRPAWEDLRSYLTARGRKRFEVYVCTMAERDYALEMWRLLDPDSNLINSKELLARIVCVKSGKLHGCFPILLVFIYYSMINYIFVRCPYKRQNVRMKTDYISKFTHLSLMLYFYPMPHACVSSAAVSLTCNASFVFQ